MDLPDTFKICLARSQNTQVYVRYFLLLEKSIKYYKDYQIKLSDKNNTVLKNENYELRELINISNKNYEIQMNLQQKDREEHIKHHKEQIEKSDEILKNNINITEKLV